MPRLQVTTKSAEQVWASPDGQRKIFKVIFEYQGKPVEARTYSEAIAKEGWSGEVETYERPGRGDHPAQTFVKQPQKDGGGYGGRQPRDDAAIKAQMAVKAAVQALGPLDPSDKRPIDEYLEGVEYVAQGLFEMVDRVKASKDAPAAEEKNKEAPKQEAPSDPNSEDLGSLLDNIPEEFK